MTWTLVMRLLDAIGRWRERRTAFRSLERLDDRLLRDIGVHRHEIALVAYHSARPMPVSHFGRREAVVLPNGSLMDLPRRRSPARRSPARRPQCGLDCAANCS